MSRTILIGILLAAGLIGVLLLLDDETAREELAAIPQPAEVIEPERQLPAEPDLPEAGLTFEAPLDELFEESEQDEPAEFVPAPPGTEFSPDSYAKTTREIFREFWRNALSWTAVDYDREAQRADLLDGRETYQVYVYLRTCLQQPLTEQQLQARIRRYERSRRSQERIERALEQAMDGLIRCEGLEDLDDLNLLAFRWLGLAAERGYPQAQVAYYKSSRWLLRQSENAVFQYPELVMEYRDRAPGYLFDAVQSGHPDALLEYSDALREGVVLAEDLESAYAYAFAADLAAGTGHSEARQAMGRMEPDLTPEQVRESGDLGRDICDRYCRSGG